MHVKRLSLLAVFVCLGMFVAGCGGNSKPGGDNQTFPIVISGVTLPTGYVGSNYPSTTLSASGGTGSGYSWSVSPGNSLPPGITLSTGGVLSGKPTTEGTTNFSVTVTDTAATTATTPLSMVVKAGVKITNAAALADAYVGVTYSQTMAATGGTGTGYAWTVASGSTLPDGLTLSAAGVLAGKPTTAGDKSFSVTVTDSAQNTATSQFSVSIKAALAISTPPALPAAYVGLNYSQTMAASGGTGTGYTWTVASGSALPDGLTLSSAGVLAGKPTTVGDKSFSVTVTDSAQNTATSQFSISIKAEIAITTAPALPTAYVGVNYSQTMAATGGTGSGYTWSVASGSTLPDGLTLSAAGVLAGKPTTAGDKSFSLTVTDSAQNTATTQFSVSIKAALAISTPPALPTAYVGSYYAQQLQATGGSGTYTWSLATQSALRAHARRMATSGLPDGLALSSDGWITGTPTQTGTTTTTVIATDSDNNSASLDVTIVIGGALVITTSPTLPGGHPGDIYSQVFAATGGSGTGYTWSGADLPGGLNVATNGTLSGTLPAVNTYTFTVTVMDSAGNSTTANCTLKVTNELRFATQSALPKTYVGINYRTSIQAKGGSGTGYRFSADANIPAGVHLSNTGAVTGTPTTAGDFDFNVTVTDSASNTAQAPFELTVDPALAITSPAALPGATVATAYSQTLTTSGGAGTGLIWTLTSGASSLSAVGLSFSNGVVSGTPSAVGTATFSVSAVDDSLTRAAITFTIQVRAAGPGHALSGTFMLGNACGNPPVPAITVSLDSNPVTTVTSDASGNYSFPHVPDGTYTITPSIAGANSIFYPAAMPITVHGGAVNNLNFTASLTFKVSGTVTYAGHETGQVYVWLLDKNCGGFPLGTSISAPGAFTVEGVPPGTYTLDAAVDSLGFGYQNDVDASGLAIPDVTVADADVTGTTITLTDPTQSALTSGPTINAITGNDNGVVIDFTPIIGPHPAFNLIELATAYEVQWADQSPFPAQPTGSKTFAAGGSNGTGVLMLTDANLVPGTMYYFRMRGVNQAGPGPWTNYSKLLVAAPAGNQVSGTVAFDAQPTGPLYVGYYDVTNGNIYATRIQNPVNPQDFTLQVPTGQAYFQFAVLDQNNDGMIDPGDVSNTHSDSLNIVAVTGDSTEQNLYLNATAAKAIVTTSHFKSTNADGSHVENYSLFFLIKQANKLPVSVRLVSGPHILHPVDLGKCLDCGITQFAYNVNTFLDMPAAGDSYGLLVTYSDGTSETLTAPVTAVSNAFATGLAPSGTSDTSLTPTFTWTYPANEANYYYQFSLSDNQGNIIWQIPGNENSNAGFTALVTSLTWGTDPTDASNHPSVGALTHGVTYSWLIRAIDADGNSAEQRTWYKP